MEHHVILYYIIINVACLIILLGMVGWVIRTVFGAKGSKRYKSALMGIFKESWGLLQSIILFILNMIASLFRGLAWTITPRKWRTKRKKKKK